MFSPLLPIVENVKLYYEYALLFTSGCDMLKKYYNQLLSPPGMLTVSEVTRMLHVHANTVRLWSKIGVLKSYRIGQRRDYRFNIEDIETFLHKDAPEGIET